jgi:signal transduction histidine kinase
VKAERGPGRSRRSPAWTAVRLASLAALCVGLARAGLRPASPPSAPVADAVGAGPARAETPRGSLESLGRRLRREAGRLKLGALDVAGQRAAEDRRREVQLLREQAEFKTEFLRTAAHEIGTPLTPIRIQVHILRGLLAGPGREEERKAVEILGRNLDRLQVLVRGMLESARLQSGRLGLSVRPFDLAQVVRDVVETFQEQALQAGVALDAEGPDGLPVVADPDRISQVLYNLLSNAMKFTPAGGRVHVRVAGEPGGRVRVAVEDTGAGFSAEDGARLFQPFTQLHAGPPGRPHGSGLGLYISRGIVEQHGGTLAGASPGPGLGASFTFVLPRVSEPAPPEPAADVCGGGTEASRSRTDG